MSGHLAAVAFMVHAVEVQEPVQQQQAQLIPQGVSVFGGLFPGGFE